MKKFRLRKLTSVKQCQSQTYNPGNNLPNLSSLEAEDRSIRFKFVA